MKDLEGFIKDEIGYSFSYFEDEEDFLETLNHVDLVGDMYAKYYNCGYVRALEVILTKLEEYNTN
jgi:hypothetical protein